MKNKAESDKLNSERQGGEIGKHARLKIVCLYGLGVRLPPLAPMPAHKLPDKNFRWTSELAYAIGLIATDGSLSSSGRHIAMLSSEKELLRTFCKCLNLSKEKIRQRKPTGFGVNPNRSSNCKPTYRVQFSNVQLYRWLTKIGLYPNKTYSLGAIKIPNKYFKDFLRGELDGDGTVFTYIDRYLTHKNPNYIYRRLYVKFASASEEHMRWLQRKIFSITGLKGALVKKKKDKRRDNSVPIWRLKYSKKESIELLNWIYYKPDLPCLKRKYEIAKPFLKN